MARDNGQGIFTMDFIKSVEGLEPMVIKIKAYDLINASTATIPNRQKAIKMLNDSKNYKALMLGMSSFMLSHSGMKVLK